MTFNKNISGTYFAASSDNAGIYTANSDGSFGGWLVGSDFGSSTNEVVATGWQTRSKSGTLMSEIVGGKWIDLKDGWHDTGYMLSYSQQQAQALVKKIIANNQQIIQNNLFCAHYASLLTAKEQQLLYDLQTRLTVRNQSLLSDGMVGNVQTSQPAGYALFEKDLQRFMNKGVGVVVTTTAVVVVSAIVLSAFATAAYFAYKYYLSESEQDVRYSDELTRTLMEKLTAEEYEQLKQETAGLITKAKLQARLGSAGKITKLLLLAAGVVGAGYAAKKLKKQ